MDEGGKLAQPRFFTLGPGHVEFKSIRSESSRSSGTSYRSRLSYSPHPYRSNTAPSTQAKNSSPLTSRLPSTFPTDGPFLYHRSPNSNYAAEAAQHGHIKPEDSSGSKRSPSASLHLNPATSTIKKEEDDVDIALAMNLNPGDSLKDSGDRDGKGTDYSQDKHDEPTSYPDRLRYAQIDDILNHTARPPSRSTPRPIRGPSPFTHRSSQLRSSQALPGPPPSAFSDTKQEWTVNLLVFCSGEDEGLGRKDDESLGFPT